MTPHLFFWGMQFFLGAAFAVQKHWVILLPIIGLLILKPRPEGRGLVWKGLRNPSQSEFKLPSPKGPGLLNLDKYKDIIFTLAGFGFVLIVCPPHNFSKIEGYGEFLIEKISPSQSPFVRSNSFKGRFKAFKSGDEVYTNVPCSFFYGKVPQQGSRFIIEGTLEKKGANTQFKPKKTAPWIPLNGGFSWARFRFDNKNKIRAFFHKNIKNKPVSHFFASITTGDVDDRLLSMQFQKVGLGHILAISGLHFALIAAGLGWILKKIFSAEIAAIFLLLLLSLYFLFLGVTPSVLRAFVMVFLYLLALLFNRKTHVLNLLAVALFFEVLYDPYTLTQLGFQLSFLATVGILLFYKRFDAFLQKFFPKRTFAEVKNFDLLDKHGYLLLFFIRNALALDMAVMLTTLPICFFVFHEFPLLSIPYNLLFPPLLTVSMLVIPLTLTPLKFISVWYTNWVLSMIENPPEILNYKLYAPNFSFTLLTLIMTSTLLFGLTKSPQTGHNRL